MAHRFSVRAYLGSKWLLIFFIWVANGLSAVVAVLKPYFISDPPAGGRDIWWKQTEYHVYMNGILPNHT